MIEYGPFELSFDDLSGSEALEQKGHPIKNALLMECNRVGRKSVSFFVFALLIFIVPAMSYICHAHIECLFDGGFYLFFASPVAT